MDNENNNNQVDEKLNQQNGTVEGNEGTGKVDTQTTKQNEGAFKVFQTQEDYQKAVDALMKSKLPSKDEMEEFKKYKESKKTDAEKAAEKETAYQKALTDVEEKDKTIAILRSGVSRDYEDFVQYTVSKMDGDFEENLTQFLKDNPKYLGKSESDNDDPRNNTDGVSVKNMNNKKDSGVSAILKQKHPELFN
jgi:hypothetical protein